MTGRNRGRRALSLALNLFGDAMVIVLARDLLYLWFVGAWQELNKATLLAELVLLWLLIEFGVMRFIWHVVEARHDNVTGGAAPGPGY